MTIRRPQDHVESPLGDLHRAWLQAFAAITECAGELCTNRHIRSVEPDARRPARYDSYPEGHRIGVGMSQRSTAEHHCACGTRLALDNPGVQCSRCQRVSRGEFSTPLPLPVDSWRTERFADAFARQHIGLLVRAYRLHPAHRSAYGPAGISQAQMGQWLGLGQPQVSRLETGPPVRNLDTLSHWARVLAIPPTLLWFDLPRVGSPVPGPGSHSGEAPDVDRRQVLGALAGLGAMAGLSGQSQPLDVIRQLLNSSLPQDAPGYTTEDWMEVAYDHAMAYQSTPPEALLPELLADVLALRDAIETATASQVQGLYQGRPLPSVLRQTEAALGLAGDQISVGRLQVLACRAKSLARLGAGAEAENLLRRLSADFSSMPVTAGMEQSSLMSWPEQNLFHTASFVYTATGRFQSAIDSQDAALTAYPQSMTRCRAQIELHRAACLVTDGQIAGGLDHAGEVFGRLPIEHRTRNVRVVAGHVLSAVPGTAVNQPVVRTYREVLSTSTDRA
ncbi:helix-turn-helix domain-containing protein [Kribbella sp. DT2]|uniref:helix-turn-helix domain-containing protein n=1 Tax=Kribbella sp. DT2 TaxID=3393427 RepID=UPI003CF6978A